MHKQTKKHSKNKQATPKKAKSGLDLVRDAGTELGLTLLVKAVNNVANGGDGRSYATKAPTFKVGSFDQLCDVTLVSEDKVEFPAHLCILSARLDYFKSMFR